MVMNQNDEKVERQHLCSASLLLFSALLQNLNSTELNRSWLDQTKLDWKAKKGAGTKFGLKKLRQTCILATLSIPANLWSSWSTLQPSLVNLSSTLQGALLDNPWRTLVNNPWWQPGKPSWLLNCGKPVEEKWTPGHPVDPLQIHQITHSSAFIA